MNAATVRALAYIDRMDESEARFKALKTKAGPQALYLTRAEWKEYLELAIFWNQDIYMKTVTLSTAEVQALMRLL